MVVWYGRAIGAWGGRVNMVAMARGGAVLASQLELPLWLPLLLSLFPCRKRLEAGVRLGKDYTTDEMTASAKAKVTRGLARSTIWGHAGKSKQQAADSSGPAACSLKLS